MNANDFTWYQRGQIDFMCGVSYGNCPAQTLFERDEWEKGWQEQYDSAEKRRVSVGAKTPASLFSRMPEV